MQRSVQRARFSVWLGTSIAIAASCLLIPAAGASAAIGEAERVADINPGPLGSSPVSPVALGRQIVFRGVVSGLGDELVVSDGTTAGTQVIDTVPGPFGSIPGSLTRVGDLVVFAANDAAGDELWRTDGTAAGTFRLADIDPGPASSSPRGFLNLGPSAVFKADDGSSGSEPWRTDGTAAGTARIADVNPGPGSGTGSFFFPERLGDFVMFAGGDAVTGSELWRLPVAGAGAQLVANINLAGESQPLELTPVGSTLFLLADDGVTGRELWRSDGQPGGSYALIDNFDSAPTDSGVTGLTAFGNHVYFRVDGDGNQTELWRADANGAEIVKDINPVGDSNPAFLTPVGDWLYFTAFTAASGNELWRSDGVPGGTTEMVADINPAGSGTCASPRITEVGGTIFFCATDGTSGTELWRTDGTPAGTSRVADINPGPGSSNPTQFVVSGDTLYFSASDGSSGAELWAVDTARPDTSVASGPAAGTLIADRTPAFQLTSTALDLARFECSATGAAGTFTPCAGRDGAAELTALDDGAHQLAFRAVDVRDNADDEPAVVPVRIDATAPRVVVRGRRVKLDDRGRVKLKILCKGSEASGPCRGTVALKTARGKAKAKVAKRKLKLKPGKAKRLRLNVKPRKLAALERAGAVRAEGRARDRLGNERRFRSKRLRVSGP